MKLGHDVMIMESLERPCSLCPVDAVDMFTGSMVICRLIVVSNDDTRDGRMLTVTSFRSGLILNCRLIRSICSSRFKACSACVVCDGVRSSK